MTSPRWARLFDTEGILVAGDGVPAARGRAEIQRAGWLREWEYLAEPRQVVAVRDVALVVGRRGITVTRRDRGGTWRYLIVVLQTNPDDQANSMRVG